MHLATHDLLRESCNRLLMVCDHRAFPRRSPHDAEKSDRKGGETVVQILDFKEAPIDLGEHPFNADCSANVAEKLGIKKHGIGMKKCPKFERQFWEFSGYGPKCPNPLGQELWYSAL